MISIVQAPYKYTPAENRIIFQVQSDNPNFTYFKVEILEATSLQTISRQEITPFPNYVNGSYIDISDIISNAVKWEVTNTQFNLYVPIKRPILKYKVKIIETGIVAGLITDLSTLILPDTYTTWEAEMGGLEFHGFNPAVYVIGNTGLPAKFLTYKPNSVTVNQFSTEQLYFMQDYVSTLKIVVKAYHDVVLEQTYTEYISGLNLYNMFMIQVSPKVLGDYFLIDFGFIDNYTVHLEDVDGNIKSEVRKYKYEVLDCQYIPVNIGWLNSIGGFDWYQFVNPIESNEVSRNSFKKQTMQFVNGFFVDKVKDVFNSPEEIINVKQSGNYTVHTRFLTDRETKWLNELVISKQVFQELGDNSLLPIVLETKNYKVDRQQYDRTKPIVKTFDYHYDGQIIPAEMMVYANSFNGNLSMDFISDQFEEN
ncbi:MAG: hypothetical protein QM737_02760 [Ferruginibacter sp.]